MKRLMFFTISLFLFSTSKAQESCKVSAALLTGTYTGDCANGKANGKGKAIGVDSYEGDFKNGYPEGYGTYTFANKDTYTGQFKKGVREGKGTMTYSSGGKDTVLTGFWKKDKYTGEYEKPYQVHYTGSKINRIDIRKQDAKGSTLNFNVHAMTSTSNNNIRSSSPVLFTITEVNVIRGLYINLFRQSVTNSTNTRLTQVGFPFRANIFFSNGERAEISFYEPGDYDVNVSLQ